MNTLVLTAGLIAGIALDLASLVLNVRRCRRVKGPSGVPGVSLLIYVVLFVYVTLSRDPALPFGHRHAFLLGLLAFHLVCHAGPQLVCYRRR
ncbi:MAG: hypothetical protein IT208_11380 [Chthonomonadales bacterium]|nr:hypothetical protein [Chthonomonadales bacterium]